jgi:hypothetical protein
MFWGEARLGLRKRLRSPRGLATVHTPEGIPLPPKILVCAAIVKIRDEHRLGTHERAFAFFRAAKPPRSAAGGIERNRKFVDSLLEGTGFELLVRGRGEAGLSRLLTRGPLPPGSARENPEACPSGIRHVGGAKLNQALVRSLRCQGRRPSGAHRKHQSTEGCRRVE